MAEGKDKKKVKRGDWYTSLNIEEPVMTDGWKEFLKDAKRTKMSGVTVRIFPNPSGNKR